MNARVRRVRGARESLASIVLGLETVVVFLGGLTLHGLDALPNVPSWWGIVAGVVFAVVLVLTIPVLRYRWGIALGWVWQVIIAAGGFIVPALLFVALIFGGMYAYATIKGGALDARNARLAAQTPDTNGDPS
ncbi:DUF4233 domain-containing protein [Microbacterium sp. MC2]